MPKGIFEVPYPVNEPVFDYAPGTPERAALKQAINDLKSREVDIPMYIGGKEVRTGNKEAMRPPHELSHTLGYYHKGDKEHIQQAIDAALAAKEDWEAMRWEERASIFLRAAHLLRDKYRYKINAATMLGQSKNAFQAEIDAAVELIDFLNYNVHYMTEIYDNQPYSPDGVWNRMDYQALGGFVVAITPFNFTSICANLPTSPAMMGNTVVWKPSKTQVYSAQVIMEVLHEAGLPDGVINMVISDGPPFGEEVFNHEDFAGIHFTGSTGTFQYMWKTIGENITKYKCYPRIVGETGGKDFILAHRSSLVAPLATAMTRGAFEYQGQKCSAASRAYIPSNLWPQVKEIFLQQLSELKMGSVEDFGNFVNAVIDETSFDKLAGYIDDAKNDENAEIIAGGNYDKSEGYFIEPTVILCKDPNYVTMREELFGPVLSVFVYDENDFEGALKLVDETSPYGLTGAIFSQDRSIVEQATQYLRHAAGNFYINDKPTGAVVGQQPFGGGRASGTNDKAGSSWNLIRWVWPRAIKENFNPPSDYRYPFMDADK